MISKEDKQKYDERYNRDKRTYTPIKKKKPKKKRKKRMITEVEHIPKEGIKGWHEKFMKLRALNILYFIKKISISDFVQEQYDIDETIMMEAKRIAKKEGISVRTQE